MSKWDWYCAVKSTPLVPTPDDILTPPLPHPLCLCEQGDAAWKDDRSLRCNLATQHSVRWEGHEGQAVIGRVKTFSSEQIVGNPVSNRHI